MEIRELFERTSSDYENTINRFMGNEALMEKFVKKFLQDKVYEKLGEAVADYDVEKIRMESHTLKGISANLGFMELCESSARLTEAARDGETGALAELFDDVKEKYQEIVALILELD